MRNVLGIMFLFGAAALLGCNTGKRHAGRASGVVISSATSSPTKVAPGGSFQLSVAASTSSTAVYKWSQVSGPTATFNNGSEAASVALTAPASPTAPAGWMEFRVEVRSGPTGPPAFKEVFVLFDGVSQHEIEYTGIDNPSGTPDGVRVVLKRKDGSPVTGKTSVNVEVVVILSGETHTRNGVLLPSQFDTTVSFGVDNAGQAIDVSNCTLRITVRENGEVLKGPDFITATVPNKFDVP